MLLLIPGVLKQDQVDTVLGELGQSAYEDGRASAGLLAREVKNNLQAKRDAEVVRKCGPMLLEALRRNGTFYSAALPHRVHGPMFNRYDVGMTYGLHVDNAIMGGDQVAVRSDVSATLFLSAPNQYDGGELVIQENTGEKRIKLPQGSMVVYSSTSAHRVEPVTRGSRLAAIFWVQSMVRDEPKREILFDLNQILAAVRDRLDSNEQMALTAVYHNLLRTWAET
ncbi:MAG TPA: Fe2+-dependent dioxygenase [Burkholderiales bacterium]|nr:Fe2+-dependent dioxygenase [Burkholderiales bacterium]